MRMLLTSNGIQNDVTRDAVHRLLGKPFADARIVVVVDAIRSYGLRVGCIQERRELAPKKRIRCAAELPWSLDVSRVPGRPQE